MEITVERIDDKWCVFHNESAANERCDDYSSCISKHDTREAALKAAKALAGPNATLEVFEGGVEID